MSKVSTLLLSLLMLLVVNPLLMASVFFNDGTYHLVDYNVEGFLSAQQDYTSVDFVNGGVASNIEASFGCSTVTVSGGLVTNGLSVRGGAVINLVGSGFSVNGTPVLGGGLYPGTSNPSFFGGSITGTLQDGTPINVSFNIQASSGSCSDIIIINSSPIDPVCPDPPASDMNGDCIFNLLDFALIIEEWLDCNLVNQNDCP